MRLLIVGAGSIGRRHAINAATRCEVLIHDSDAARSRAVAAASGATVRDDLDDALRCQPDAAVVATPPADHADTATRLLEAGCDVLVEKPLADRAEAAHALAARAASAGRRLYVACNMRFHAGPWSLRAHLHEIGQPLFARAHFGHWLPNMRPDSDYRELYCARREAGGGVMLDGIHELDYLTWLLGPVTDARGTTARLSSLAIDAEDYAAFALTHAGGARSEIHLDYLQACKRRGCEITGSEGTLVWDSEGKRPEHCRVRLFRHGTQSGEIVHEDPDVDPNAAYLTMLDRFLDAVRGAPADDLLDGATAARELAIALGVRDHGAAPTAVACGGGA